ncbi:MAG TPA: sigma-54 dependent transcriptional regulator [Acidobacteriaceae bacterium]|jgi:two-component system response regulator AtoC|nr:sigma-54 dependent transcriptional regulator [Acidobacteriaceae bacterium]
MDSRIPILVADSEPSVGKYLANLLDPTKFHAKCVTTGAACLEMIHTRGFMPQLLILDAALPDIDGLEMLAKLRKQRLDFDVAMTSYYANADFVLEASRTGATAFLNKPISRDDVAQVTECLASKSTLALAQTPDGLVLEELGDGYVFLAASPAMRQIRAQVATIARTDVPVLITGESGVGKEVVSRLIHVNSARAKKQLLKVNCAALPADLLESELFGYEAGAFTGAMKPKPGKFELCDRGTILMDEIGEMSPQLQAKLLHVLQDGTFSRLGGRTNTKVDVRILAATNIDIEKSIENKTFREDLYYRLNAFVLHVPPLRERRQEIPYLLNDMATRLATTYNVEPIGFSPRLIAASLEYHWPGNLRELGNFVKRYIIMRDETVAVVELESKTKSKPMSLAVVNHENAAPSEDGLKFAVRSSKDEIEIKAITTALGQANWNRRIAAEKLQISYKTLLYKIRQYHLEASA